MKKFSMVVALILTLSLICTSAFACTALYVGSNLTADGTVIFAREEDISNSYNKMMFVIPAGVHQAGEEYVGCYGFTYTFTQESYGYTAFQDDNMAGVDNVCPDCGETHLHTPYQSGGTNSEGLTVSATESIGGGAKAIRALDPYTDEGIEEAEITTVLLSECANAQEALALLCKIYDEVGAAGGSGIFIADINEVWYIENVTGHQYIAVKCSDDLIFSEPNMSIIGLIDLDDTDNVIASEGLIALAQQAESFVGDAEANTIDFVASYSKDQTSNARIKAALNYFAGEELFTDDNMPVPADFCISNVNAEGEIVPMYTNIKQAAPFTILDAQNYYHNIPSIGAASGLETHIFQLDKTVEDPKKNTVEWVAMDCCLYTDFVPYFPMLTTDVYAPLKLSTAKAVFTQEEPTEGLYYPAQGKVPNPEGGRMTVDGFKSFPANWADSYYWCSDALSNLCIYGGFTAEQVAAAKAASTELQLQINETFANTVKPAVMAAGDDAAACATSASESMAEMVHMMALEQIEILTAK